MVNTAEIFGNEAKFAIRYLPCPKEYNYEQSDKYAICHLVINNVIIGTPTEECYLPTWFSQLLRNRDFIKENKKDLYQKDFISLTDREIFEIIIKSNETENEFDEKYLYLPQLDSTVWHRHIFFLDETIDAFIICYYIFDGFIRFIIKKECSKEENENQERFIYSAIDLNGFLAVIDSTIQFLRETYPYLSDNVIN